MCGIDQRRCMTEGARCVTGTRVGTCPRRRGVADCGRVDTGACCEIAGTGGAFVVLAARSTVVSDRVADRFGGRAAFVAAADRATAGDADRHRSSAVLVAIANPRRGGARVLDARPEWARQRRDRPDLRAFVGGDTAGGGGGAVLAAGTTIAARGGIAARAGIVACSGHVGWPRKIAGCETGRQSEENRQALHRAALHRRLTARELGGGRP